MFYSTRPTLSTIAWPSPPSLRGPTARHGRYFILQLAESQLPVEATIGAVAGALAAPSAKEFEQSRQALDRALGDLNLPCALLAGMLEAAGDHPLIPLKEGGEPYRRHDRRDGSASRVADLAGCDRLESPAHATARRSRAACACPD